MGASNRLFLQLRDEAVNKEINHNHLNQSNHMEVTHKVSGILDKAAIASTVNQLMKGVDEGLVNPLEAFTQIKFINEVFLSAMEKIKELAILEAEKYGKSEFEVAGAKVQVRNAPGQWKFDHISEWKVEKMKLKDIEEQAKQAFQMKAKGVIAVSEEDGEITTPANYYPGKSTIAITFKK